MKDLTILEDAYTESVCFSAQEIINERSRTPRMNADVILRAAIPGKDIPPAGLGAVVVMGLSTGGVEALEAVLPYLPVDSPPIMIVQHMPDKLGDGFVRYMDKHCELEIRKANNGDVLKRGQALVVTGSRHGLLRLRNKQYVVELCDGPMVSLHRPSIDVLFRSAAYAGSRATGIIMTGLGDDGVQGLKEMRDCGARTLAQAEISCISSWLPRKALEAGAAAESATLTAITDLITHLR